MKTTVKKAILNVFITNLSAYNNGRLIGEWLSLPASDDDISAVFERIGVDNNFTEYFITDHESDYNIPVNEYTPISELNEIAKTISDLDEYESNILAFLITNLGLDSYNINELIKKIDDVQVYYDCDTWEDVAYQYAEETGILNSVPENLRYYFDYAAFGRDLNIESSICDVIDGDFYILW